MLCIAPQSTPHIYFFFSEEKDSGGDNKKSAGPLRGKSETVI